MPTREIALEEHTVNNLVSSIVNTSVDDGKNAVKRVVEVIKLPTAGRLRVLRGALAYEKDGQGRSSLLTAIRSAIRSQEKALEDDDLATVHEGEQPEDTAGRTQPEAIPARPDAAADEEIPDDDEEDEEPILSGVADLTAFMVHPDLAAICMMEDARKWLEKNHHGDPTRVQLQVDISHDWEAFIGEIRDHGVREAIKVVPAAPLLSGKDDGIRWQIVDGRHRWEASKQAGRATIPFEIVEECEVRAIIEGTVSGRRNYSKAQKAFLAVQFHPELFVGEQGKRTDLATSGTECQKLSAAIAEKYGVSERTLRQAVELHRKIEGKKKLTEEVRLQVWSGIGLGGILSGMAGKEATAAKSRTPSHIGTVATTLKSFRSQIKGFDEWPRTHRTRFVDEFREVIEASPASVISLITAVLNDDKDAMNAILDGAVEGGEA